MADTAVGAETAVTAETGVNTRDVFWGEIVYTGLQVTTVDGSYGGEVIGGGATAEQLAPAFDGNIETVTQITNNPNADGVEGSGEEAVDYWFGIKTTKPIVPTSFRISLAAGDKNYRIFWSYIQASTDGVNWVTLELFDDWRDYDSYTTGTYKTVNVSTETAYQYFRYFNYERRGDNKISEFQVFGVEPTNNTVDVYDGDITYTGVRSTSVGGSVVGEIIGGGVAADALLAAFDGNTATTAYLTTNLATDVSYWMGIKADAAVVPTAFAISDSVHNSIMGSYIQGSNDGVNWTTLKALTDWREYANPDQGGNFVTGSYKIIPGNGNAYRYYRYFNHNDHGSNMIGELQVVVSKDWGEPPVYVEIDTSNRDNTDGTLTMTESEDGKTVTIFYELTDGTVVTYDVPNNVNNLAGPLAGTDDLGRNMYTMEDVLKPFENKDDTYSVGRM